MTRLLVRALTVSALSLSALGCGPGSLWSGKTDVAAGSGPPYMGTIILVAVCLVVYLAAQAWKKKDKKK